MNNDPKLHESVIYWLLAAMAASVNFAIGDDGSGWWAYLLVLMVLIFFATGLVSLLNWIAFNVAMRYRQLGEARVQPVVVLAKAIKGLSQDQMDLISRYDLPSIIDQYDGRRVVHLLRCTDGKLVDLEFVGDFLRQSERRPGYLWPVREHRVFDGWVNTKQMSRSVTNSLVHWGMVRAAVGSKPAELYWSVDQIAARLGLEL